jgi:hypothetical protein
MMENVLLLGLSASFRLGEVEHLVKQLEVVVVDNDMEGAPMTA